MTAFEKKAAGNAVYTLESIDRDGSDAFRKLADQNPVGEDGPVANKGELPPLITSEPVNKLAETSREVNRRKVTVQDRFLRPEDDLIDVASRLMS